VCEKGRGFERQFEGSWERGESFSHSDVPEGDGGKKKLARCMHAL
jgi:hypothetical protein